MYIHIKGREEESVSDSKREERKRERTQKKLERSELREQKRLERENAKEQKRREEEEKQKQVFVCPECGKEIDKRDAVLNEIGRASCRERV